MNLESGRRLILAWLVVVTLTLIYLVIDHEVDDAPLPGTSTAASVVAIGLALLKSRIIIREFMDVRHAPRVLRTMTDLLVAVMAVAMLGTYLVGKAVA